MPTTLSASVLIDRTTDSVTGQLVDRHYLVVTGSPAWKAACGWCEAHGIDPHRVLAADPVIREAGAYRIRYTRVEIDELGRKIRIEPEGSRVVAVQVIEQGEAPPLPFPAEVLACPVEVSFAPFSEGGDA